MVESLIFKGLVLEFARIKLPNVSVTVEYFHKTQNIDTPKW